MGLSLLGVRGEHRDRGREELKGEERESERGDMGRKGE